MADSQNLIGPDPDGWYQLILQGAVYSLDASLKAAYKFTDRAFVQVRQHGSEIEVRFRSKEPGCVARDMAGELLNELLDETLRAKIAHETQGIRDLILAHALSASNLIDPELNAIAISEDPLGIGRPMVTRRLSN